MISSVGQIREATDLMVTTQLSSGVHHYTDNRGQEGPPTFTKLFGKKCARIVGREHGRLW